MTETEIKCKICQTPIKDKPETETFLLLSEVCSLCWHTWLLQDIKPNELSQKKELSQ